MSHPASDYPDPRALVYVPPAANEGVNPGRLVVELAVRTASCGLASFTRVHALAEP